jgi:hypothetical protein
MSVLLRWVGFCQTAEFNSAAGSLKLDPARFELAVIRCELIVSLTTLTKETQRAVRLHEERVGFNCWLSELAA